MNTTLNGLTNPPPPLSRREFLGASAALAAVTAATPAFAAEATTLRAAVIGHTGRGDYGHGLDVLFTGRGDCELAAVADPDPAGRAKAAERIKAPRQYADWREMLDKERPQLVSVAMRQADQHREICLAALRAGAHVFCEKPFVTCPAESDELLAEAQKRGLRIAVAHQMRSLPSIAALKQAITGGLIGDVLELRAFGKQDARAGGEDMIVLGSHLFDLMRLFVGDPQWCTARVLQKGRDITRADARVMRDNVGPIAGDEVNAQFGFAHGVLGTFTSRGRQRELVAHWGIEFIGSKGAARILMNIPAQVFVLKPGAWKPDGRADTWQKFEGTPAGVDNFPSANTRLVDDWLAAIREKRDPECSGRNGAWAVEMVMAVYQAALTGQRTTFPLKSRTHPLIA
ncbi:MAG: Gfo/Idh/MocA family oxidoreductase [Verrucomicrobia bacterium]|nr:Gfo/Idh/MocA family oxidoreductase [Verrucomicrobiota bacterium]